MYGVTSTVLTIENRVYFVEGTHAKSVFAVLDEDVVDASVLVEEPLDVPLPGVVRQVAQEHARGIAVFVGSPGGHGARYLK